MAATDKILIIDDDARNIFALTATLKAAGYRSMAAGSAIQGLAFLKNDPAISIILLDMMMPEMDGYEAIGKLKDIRNVYIIAVTAQAMTGDRERCLAAGADEYVSKPINVDKLFRLIDTHINAHSGDTDNG
ncbi:MAG: response regulator [Bacteroidetes bacterium 43-93]|nr:response regulator [Bacteroidota bacterium]OJW98106.1 MAG: response regulator [Bacteroidetes bacterium 43-93]